MKDLESCCKRTCSIKGCEKGFCVWLPELWLERAEKPHLRQANQRMKGSGNRKLQNGKKEGDMLKY